ncbi:MAG: peptide chain release factor 2 [Candidatus Amulumruptor caecigallinarius]|nr:peptide chain release factor 2 [Candidatus Amulumruptor caecigallinarius]
MNYGGCFDPDNKKLKIKKLEEKVSEPTFWNDKSESEKVILELNSLKEQLEKTTGLKNRIESNLELVNMLKENDDLEIKNIVEEELLEIKQNIDNLEIETFLNKPYDKEDAILEIHPGAGGTESCDWAQMLYRMYQRWCEKKHYKMEVTDMQQGEEAGIKSVTMLIKGINAYGYLKCEKGIHRLVRISPFDSNSRRHTSFAGVDITPLISKDIDIEIKQTDIRIDVYRSSGCGGQGVNTTDSAVRITHLPTKIVVTCQNERSQIQNKERAMEVLKSKLYAKELEKQNAYLESLKGNMADINFGSQIRSYVMCPYTLVKDHRTNIETSNVDKVLDGDIDIFINSALKNL